jgi:hypothetical protein
MWEAFGWFLTKFGGFANLQTRRALIVAPVAFLVLLLNKKQLKRGLARKPQGHFMSRTPKTSAVVVAL